MTTKICNTCNTEKPLEEFPKAKSCKDGHRNYCTKCNNFKKLKYYDKDKERARKALRKDQIKIYQKEYRQNNRDELAKKKKEYYKKNKEAISDQRKKYREDNIHKLKEWRIKNKDKLKEARKAYRKTEAYKLSKRNSKLKRRQKEKDGNASTEFIKMLLEESTKCYWCDKEFSKDDIRTIDHYKPLNKGGRHDEDNLVVACKSCNSSKQDKDPEVFARSVGKLL